MVGTTFSGTTKRITVDKRGIPVAVIELGGGIVDQTPYTARGVAGILNMLRTIGVVEGDPTPPPKQIVVRSIETVRPTQGGFLEILAPPLGEEIPGSTPLGQVVSPYTFEVLETIPNPYSRGIMILRISRAISSSRATMATWSATWRPPKAEMRPSPRGRG